MAELKVTITDKGSYLHALVEGDNVPENVIAYAEAIMKACEARGCLSVLVEERLLGPRLSFNQVFRLGEELSDRMRGFFRRVAYVDVTGKTDLMSFAEDVLVNRGFPMRVFGTVEEAAGWLEDQADGRDGGT